MAWHVRLIHVLVNLWSNLVSFISLQYKEFRVWTLSNNCKSFLLHFTKTDLFPVDCNTFGLTMITRWRYGTQILGQTTKLATAWGFSLQWHIYDASQWVGFFNIISVTDTLYTLSIGSWWTFAPYNVFWVSYLVSPLGMSIWKVKMAVWPLALKYVISVANHFCYDWIVTVMMHV